MINLGEPIVKSIISWLSKTSIIYRVISDELTSSSEMRLSILWWLQHIFLNFIKPRASRNIALASIVSFALTPTHQKNIYGKTQSKLFLNF